MVLSNTFAIFHCTIFDFIIEIFVLPLIWTLSSTIWSWTADSCSSFRSLNKVLYKIFLLSSSFLFKSYDLREESKLSSLVYNLFSLSAHPLNKLPVPINIFANSKIIQSIPVLTIVNFASLRSFTRRNRYSKSGLSKRYDIL